MSKWLGVSVLKFEVEKLGESTEITLLRASAGIYPKWTRGPAARYWRRKVQKTVNDQLRSLKKELEGD